MKKLTFPLAHIMRLGILFLILSQSSAFSQRIQTATVTTFTSKFQSLTATKGSNVLVSFGSQVYYTTATMSLPFDFRYDDIVYKTGYTVYMRQGHICLAANGGSDPNYQNYVGNASYPNIIAPEMGLQVSSPNGTSLWLYQTSGSAPNRVLTFEWYQWGDYNVQSLGNTSYQLKLYETSNNIEFIYQDYNFTMNNASYTSYTKGTGLNGDISKSFQAVTIQNGTIVTPKANYRFSYFIPPNVQLSATPKLLDLGSLVIGTTNTGTASVTNAGDNLNGISKLGISSVSITGDPDFSVVSYPSTLDSILTGTNRDVVIKFTPQFDGLRTAILTIVSSGKDSGTQTIALKGIGLAALISIDTNILFKNTFTKLGSTRDGRIIITSTGVPTLQITGASITGSDAGEYSILKVPSSIPGGKSDTLFVRYSPTKEGRRTAILNIFNNSLNNPALQVTLWGTGTLPHIIVTPTKLSFDSVILGGAPVCKTIRIYNPGTDTLLIFSNQLIKNDGDFTFSGISGADSILPPDKSRELTVCFSPLQKGSRVARLRLTTNIPRTFEQVRRDTASSFLFDITGNGVPTGVLSQKFGAVDGQGWTDSAIIGSEICTKDTIFNNGDADVIVNSLSVGGSAAADFTISGKNLPFVITANSSAVVNVCAKPSARGLNNATLIVGGTSSEKPVSNTAPFSIKGLAVCATSDPGLLFDNHLVVEGTDSLECVTVTNCGDVPTSYTASLPAGATDYSINGPANSGVIAAGATAQFCVRFHPSTMGSTPTTLTITPSTPELAAQTVAINGVGACANVTAAAPTIDGSAGGTFTFTVTINNAGNYPWTPGAPVLTQPESAFDITGQTVTPDPIPANGSGTLTVTYKPTEINHTYTGAITFPNAAPACSNTASINISHTTGTLAVASKSEEAGFSLGQNYPNPFGAATSFSFTTPSEASVVVAISDLTGRHIRTITSGRISAGEHPVTIDAENLTSGTYILTLESGSVRLTRQIVVVK